jgi:polyferredoxin
LLDRPIIGKILRSRLSLTLLIVPTMAIFSFIVIAGLLGEQNTSNPAVLLTWILWWPAVIFTFFILGRVWCAICPFGYLGDVAQKIFSFQLKVPAFMRNMWWRLFFFLALTWATTLWALDRWPLGTAWLALGETLGAIALAVVFEKRAFCRFVCPVGGVFGLYAMAAPTHMGVKDSKVCHQDCPEKNCYKACAWFQYPPTVERNTECTLCMECVRACPHDNLTLQAQPFGADLTRPTTHRKSVDEATAIVVILGVALVQTIVMLNGWAAWQARLGHLLNIPPGRLLFTISYVAVGVIAPVLLVSLVIYLTSGSGNSQGGFRSAFRTYALAFLPLGLALHAAHNFHHLFGEGSAMWIGLKRSLAEIAGWTLTAAGTEAGWAPSPNTLFILQWFALLGGLFLAFRVGVSLVRRNSASPQQAFRAAVPILLFATAFTILNLVVLSSAMGHRH